MTNTEITVKMIFDRWYASIKNFDALLGAILDEKLYQEIAPGRNRGIYVLGHLIAVHDDMLILLDMGEKLYPALHEPFLKLPDKAVTELPSAATLREFWANQ